MKNLMFVILLITLSCEKPILTIGCEDGECEILNPVGFFTYSDGSTITIEWRQTYIIDAIVPVCLPDEVEFFISSDGEEFRSVGKRNEVQGSMIVEDVEKDQLYFVKLVNRHCAGLEEESGTRQIRVREIALPEFMANDPFAEDLRIASDGNRYIYKTSDDRWNLTSFDNSIPSQRISGESFRAEWKPTDINKIAFIEDVRVQILENVESIESYALKVYDVDSMKATTLYEIPEPYDYWIHKLQYGLKGESIYVKSNKETNSITADNAFNDNLWALNLNSLKFELFFDFRAEGFSLTDYVEDPKSPGNFYLLGYFNSDPEFNVFYLKTDAQEITPVVEGGLKASRLQINPTGEHLVFQYSGSGDSELWTMDLNTQVLKRLTDRRFYLPTNKWNHINWVSDMEFVVPVKKTNKEYRLAKFSL